MLPPADSICKQIAPPYGIPCPLNDRHPVCHPERGSACTTESKFCGSRMRYFATSCEMAHRSKQNRERNEWQRAAGSALDFLNVCSALVAFFKASPTDYIQMLHSAGKRVTNRSEIPLRHNTGDSPAVTYPSGTSQGTVPGIVARAFALFRVLLARRTLH